MNYKITTIATLLLIVLFACESKKVSKDTLLSVELRKTIIYAEEDQCEELTLFYHDDLNIPYTNNINNDYSWVEFETGSCHLCIHHNNKREKAYKGGVINIVLYADTKEKVISLHKTFIDKNYIETPLIGTKNNKHLAPKQISEIIDWEALNGEQMFSFWVCDPIGNIVQIESKHISRPIR